jgi:hypothetical protein
MLLDGHWGYTAWVDVDVGNEALKNVAALMLSALVSPLGVSARSGPGSHLLIEGLRVDQEKLQQVLASFFKTG